MKFELAEMLKLHDTYILSHRSSQNKIQAVLRPSESERESKNFLSRLFCKLFFLSFDLFRFSSGFRLVWIGP